MPKSKVPSPARSTSALVTPRRSKPRGPRSVGSPARSNSSVRLTSVIQNFKDKNMDSFRLSPLNSRRSVLNDNTDIEEPGRRSWWKKLNDTSRDILDVLDNDQQDRPYNVMEEFMDVDVLSQEKKNKRETIERPDSSDSESISSIVIPQRKLFTQKENQPKNKFAKFLGTRESMAKYNKTNVESNENDETIVAGKKKLFGVSSKPRSKPAFPTELLRFSPDKTVNKTVEVKGQVRNLFGNRAGVKKKFADFIASESEEEPEIQPKVFGFQKIHDAPSRRVSTASSLTADIDMEDWRLLPSSTMVQTQLEAMIAESPVKKAKLSKLSEGKETETGTNSTTTTTNKTKQSNKSVLSKDKSITSKTSFNKSKMSPEAHLEKKDVGQNDISNRSNKEQYNKSVTTINNSKISNVKHSFNKSKTSPKANKNENQEMYIAEDVKQVDEELSMVPDGDPNVGDASFEKNNDLSPSTAPSLKKTLNESKATSKNNDNENLNAAVPEKDDQEMEVDDDEENRLALTYSDEEPMEPEKHNLSENVAVDHKRDSDAVDKPQVSNENVENDEKVINESLDLKTSEQEKRDEEKESPGIQNERNISHDKNQESEVEETEEENQEMDEENKSHETEIDDPVEIEEDNEDVNEETENQEVETDNEEDEIENTDNAENEIENEDIAEDEIENEENEIENEENEIENEENEIENEDNAEDEIENEVNAEDEIENEEDENDEEIELEEENVSQQDHSQEVEESHEIENEEVEASEDEEIESEEIINESVGDEGEEVIDDDQNGEGTNDISGMEEETPNVTHDVTGRNRTKNKTDVKSPEAVLRNDVELSESYTVKGRNTSIRRTTMPKSLKRSPSLAPPRESTGLSDGTRNSSAEGSGWDSHRTTRKTLRQTFGRDFTPRKSLRALVMEKSAKRHTAFNDMNEIDMPRANSTELPEESNRDDTMEDPHEISKRTRQTTLEMYLQKIKKQNMEQRKKLEEEVRSYLAGPPKDILNTFKVPARPFVLKRASKLSQSNPKKKTIKSTIPVEYLPPELIEDMCYKPPRRFQPRNASWITKRLYKFLETKLEPKYDYKARVRAEKLVEMIYNFVKDLRRHDFASVDSVDALKQEMARLCIVNTHFEFHQFFYDFMPREVRVKVVPDIINNLPLPRNGIFSEILTR